MMLAGDDVGDDFCVRGIGDRRFKDADARGRARVKALEANGFAQYGRIFLQRRGPETVRENHDAGGLRTIVLRPNEPAEDGVEAHDFEVRAADDGGLNFPGLTQADHGEADDREIAKLRDGAHAGFEVLDFGDREKGVIHAHAGGALLNVDEPVFVGIHERAEENAAHEAKDGGIGADPQGKRDDDSKRETFGPRKGAKSKPQVLNKQRSEEHTSELQSLAYLVCRLLLEK